MIAKKYSEIVTDELLVNSLDHNPHTGFLEDYRVLTCLLRIYQPRTVLEIGTNIGSGVNVISTALPRAKVYSIDLPFEERKLSQQYPVSPDGKDLLGSAARFQYTQICCDTLTFNFRLVYPIEAFFIDGEHDYTHPFREASEAIKSNAKLIVFHDADEERVYNAITDAFNGATQYIVYRVEGTRIAYAVNTYVVRSEE